MPAAVRYRWTADEVRNLQDESRHWPRYELIDGELYVTPGPAIPHQRAVMGFVETLLPYVRSLGFADILTSPADIELEEESILQPDVFIFPSISKEIERPVWKDITSLLLAIEIISASSVHTDRVIKRDGYMRMAVDEYWVVDLDGRQVERWFRGRPHAEVARDKVVWHPKGATRPLVIELPGFFVDIGLPRVI